MGTQRSDGEARASRRAGTGPTYPPPQPGGLSPVLERNLGWVPVVPAWDPSFVVLAMVAAVEAIFLSTFVLVSQNRMRPRSRSTLRVAKSRWPEPLIPLGPAAGRRSSPRALRAWSPSWTICACASRAGRVRPADRASNHSAEAVFRRA